MSQTQTAEAGIFAASNRFPHGNFPMAISLFPHADLHMSKKIFSMRRDLETIFLLGFFLVVLWSDVWTGCVFYHLHLVWIATSGAHYSGAGPKTDFPNLFLFLKQSWNSCSARFLDSPRSNAHFNGCHTNAEDKPYHIINWLNVYSFQY